MLLYYITDRHGFAGTETQQRTALLQRISEAARAGVDYIQLREKDLPSEELGPLAAEAATIVRANSVSTRVLVNHDVNVAIENGTDGVHLPAGDITAFEVRSLWMSKRCDAPVIGVSVHSIGEVRNAEIQGGADFVVLAPIFEKPGTDMRGIGLNALRIACHGDRPPNTAESARPRIPVLALGGVSLVNAGSCLNAGAAGVAGIRLFQQGDVAETVIQLRELSAKTKMPGLAKAKPGRWIS